MATRGWVEQYAFDKLKSLEKLDRYLFRGHQLLQSNKLQHCAWQADDTLTATCLGSGTETYDVSLHRSTPNPYETQCSCPSHDRDGICKHALAALLWMLQHPPDKNSTALPAAVAHQPPTGIDNAAVQYPLAGQHVQAAAPAVTFKDAFTAAAPDAALAAEALGGTAASPAPTQTQTQASKRKRMLPGSLRPPSVVTQAAAAQDDTDNPRSAAYGKARAAHEHSNDEQEHSLQRVLVRRSVKPAVGSAKRRLRVAPPATAAATPAAAREDRIAAAAAVGHVPAAVQRYPWLLLPDQMLAVEDEQLLEQARHCLQMVGRPLPAKAAAAAAVACPVTKSAEVPVIETAVEAPPVAAAQPVQAGMLAAEVTLAAAQAAQVPIATAAVPQHTIATLPIEEGLVTELRQRIHQQQQQLEPQQQQLHQANGMQMPQQPQSLSMAVLPNLQQQHRAVSAAAAQPRPRSTGLSRLLFGDTDDFQQQHTAASATQAQVAASLTAAPSSAAPQHQQEQRTAAHTASVLAPGANSAAAPCPEPAAAAGQPVQPRGSTRSNLAMLASRFFD